MHSNPYIIPTFLIMSLAGQVIGWRLWLRLLPPKAGGPVHLVFILFNLAWLATLATLYPGDSAPGRFWPWVGRPALAWQFAYILVILPLGVLASSLISLARLWRPRKPAGPPPPPPGGPRFQQKSRGRRCPGPKRG
ncbi:MAG: hypothetical protein LBP55_01475, partial [Candidatus Adiutrix sp.]|nr:hypothetical protein [Candidatus Adiutrix sp.]